MQALQRQPEEGHLQRLHDRMDLHCQTVALNQLKHHPVTFRKQFFVGLKLQKANNCAIILLVELGAHSGLLALCGQSSCSSLLV